MLAALAFPRGSSARQRPTANAARIAWLVSEIQHAVAQGRYVRPPKRNALHYLRALKRLDPTGARSAEVARKMSRTLREDADRLWIQGDRERARALYTVISALRPEDARAHARAGHGQSPARAASRVTARRLVSEGKTLLRAGNLAQARERFLAAVRADPGHAPAVTALATVEFEEARYARTVELAKRALSMDRRQVAAQLLVGDAYYKLLRYDDARMAWQRVLELEPGNKRAARRIAMIAGRGASRR
jgi:tetratricopeptide (TPR) repeat protein